MTGIECINLGFCSYSYHASSTTSHVPYSSRYHLMLRSLHYCQHIALFSVVHYYIIHLTKSIYNVKRTINKLIWYVKLTFILFHFPCILTEMASQKNWFGCSPSCIWSILSIVSEIWANWDALPFWYGKLAFYWFWVGLC